MAQTRKDKHNVDEVIKALSRKKDLTIKQNIQQIQVLNGEGLKAKPKMNDIGHRSWGKIDYLVNYCSYSLVFVPNFS